MRAAAAARRGGDGEQARPNHFISVKITDGPLVEALVEAQGRLKATVALEAIPRAKFHFTLALLRFDQQRQDKAGEAAARVAAALGKHLRCQFAFEQAVRGVGSFGDGVVFARADGEERLRGLQQAVVAALRSECPDLEHREKREWQAHCTLFKGRGRGELPSLAAEKGTRFGTQSVVTVSVCRMGGAPGEAGYVTLAEVPLLRVLTFAEMEASQRPAALAACHALEEESYPPDEAATLERMQMRSERAAELFAVLLRPDGSPVGFVNATACCGELTAETMRSHDPAGPVVCIHSLVIAQPQRRRGLAGALLQHYMGHLAALGRFDSAHLLCRRELVPLYERFGGFVCEGPSRVVHGSTPWFDCSASLKCK